MDTRERVADHFSALSAALGAVDQESVMAVVNFLASVRVRGGMVWIIGNGGSAATASHLANDLRKAANLSAISLPDQTPTVTAYGNDNGWISMFSGPLHLFLRAGDCLIAISCSGNSANIVEAARSAGASRLVVLTGNPGPRNTLATFPSKCIVYAQSPDIKVQESVHTAICHAIVAGLMMTPGELTDPALGTP